MTQTASDPYAVLGLDPSATTDDVRRAYHGLARRLHPDLAGEDPDAAEELRRVNAAYEAITRPRPTLPVEYVTYDLRDLQPAKPSRRVSAGWVLGSAVVLCLVLLAMGTFLGRSGGADLRAAEKAGAAAGAAAGHRSAAERDLQRGIAAGKRRGYETFRLQSPVTLPAYRSPS